VPAIVAVRPEFREVVDLEAEAEKVAGGFVFTEGPVWDSRRGVLIFSDIPADRMYEWSPDRGHRLFREPSGGANGNTIDATGALLTCEHTNRRVSRSRPGGPAETLVDRYEGRRLNSPNDVVVSASGDVYFTDPPYGLRQPDGTFAPGELGFFGVFRFSPATGVLALLVDDFVRPNGIALSTDGRTLFVADTDRAHVRAFDVTPGGALTNGRVFARTEHDGVVARPDGIKLDERGNLYVTSSRQQGVWVYDPSGRLLGQIAVGENPANCGFGGEDWRTLFVTAQTSVYRIRLKVAGQPVPPH
jgi:sugar lactone lactonase YvrE